MAGHISDCPGCFPQDRQRRNAVIMTVVFLIAAIHGFSLIKINPTHKYSYYLFSTYVTRVQISFWHSRRHPRRRTTPASAKEDSARKCSAVLFLSLSYGVFSKNSLFCCKSTGTMPAHSPQKGPVMRSKFNDLQIKAGLAKFARGIQNLSHETFLHHFMHYRPPAGDVMQQSGFRNIRNHVRTS